MLQHSMPRHALLAVIALQAPAALGVERPKSAPAPAVTSETFKGLEFRNIGPAIMGGRIDDLAVVETDPSTFYVATASGGVFKTINGGVTFEPVFDDQDVSTIGDIAVAPSDPSVLYVGTGEPNNRQSSSWGNGVYKTTDAGRSWTHAGLRDTHHIGRIVVHPRLPELAYVAALGHLWGANKERGLFKTSDGGKTWLNVKFIDEDTGFVDVAMDPESPDTLYAASYQRRRTPFGFNGGGPGSALWKTTDGGASWKKLAKGLPEGELGRIGVAVYRGDPRIVYATVEHAKEAGVYRSEDKGESWAKVSPTNPRPSYYSKIHVDPNNDRRVWVLGARMYYSEDGGKTFVTDLVQKIHGDHHGFWIDPADSNHTILGSDGGIHVSRDRGRSWDYVNTLALAQFYEISLDSRRPYNVCGGLQDNGSWLGPSRTLHQQGIANEDWVRVGGGDGFYCVIDPTEPDILYVESQDGNVQRLHLGSFERRTIRPEPPEGAERYRFNWNSPILVSPHDPKTVYYGGNRLFGSKDRGETWTLVTPDLTSNAQRDKMSIFGKTAKDFLSRNDGVVHFGTITALAESPLKPGILWAGTDDGNLQVSRDGGATWTNVAPKLPGVPKGTYVSRVEASRTGEGAAYVALDGHRGNDFAVYLFRTEDFGQTWKPLAANIPSGATVSAIREHPKRHDLLFVGTESVLWASWNRGASWVRLKSKLPTVPVDDVQIHPRDDDLVLATHGRGVWIFDDLTPLVQMDDTVLAADLHLFDMRPATQWRIYNHKANTGHKALLAPNPPDGALISFYLKAKPGDGAGVFRSGASPQPPRRDSLPPRGSMTEGRSEDASKDAIKITVKDAAGNVVRELKGPAEAEAGVTRVNWDLRHEPPVPPDPEGPGFGGPPRGPFVPPGTYSVTVSLGSWSATKPVVVEEDPRIRVAEAERQAWHEAARAAARLWTRADAASKAAESLIKQLTDLQDAFKKDAKAPEAVSSAVKALTEKAEPLARRLKRQTPLGFAGAPLSDDPEPLLDKSRGLHMTFSSMTAAPTPQHRMLLDRTTRQLDDVAAGVNALMSSDVPELNKLMLDNAMGKVEAARKIE